MRSTPSWGLLGAFASAVAMAAPLVWPEFFRDFARIVFWTGAVGLGAGVVAVARGLSRPDRGRRDLVPLKGAAIWCHQASRLADEAGSGGRDAAGYHAHRILALAAVGRVRVLGRPSPDADHEALPAHLMGPPQGRLDEALAEWRGHDGTRYLDLRISRSDLDTVMSADRALAAAVRRPQGGAAGAGSRDASS